MACKESVTATTQVLSALMQIGHDYTAARDEIEDSFDGLLNGNWRMSADLGDGHSLRIINEDEYDQHMDFDDDRPDSDDQLCFVAEVSAYVWFV